MAAEEDKVLAKVELKKPLGPLGPPKKIEHKVQLGFAQLSRSDLARFLDLMLRDAQYPDVAVWWTDGSHTPLDPKDASFGEQIESIVQVEKIRFVSASGSFEDGSRISAHLLEDYQLFSSTADKENTVAENRVYDIRNTAGDGGGSRDVRLYEKRKVRTRYMFALMVLSVSFGVCWILISNISGKTFTPLWWITIVAWAWALVGQFVVAHSIKKLQVPALNAVTLKYPALSEKRDLSWWASVGSIVAAIAAVVTIVLMLMQG